VDVALIVLGDLFLAAKDLFLAAKGLFLPAKGASQDRELFDCS
jgi:hypothetical protein